MSYTKGQWYVSGGDKYATIQSRNMDEKIVVTYPTIGTVNSTFIDEQEFRSNALLISKAPELLEFLKKYYRFLNLNDQKEAEKLIDSATIV